MNNEVQILNPVSFLVLVWDDIFFGRSIFFHGCNGFVYRNLVINTSIFASLKHV